MGLDISIYTNVKKTNNEWGDENSPDFTAYVLTPEWNDRISKLEINANYIGEYSGSLAGYAYSTHSKFRNSLCELSGQDSDVWIDGSMDKEDDFYYLCCFADNEGVIDWGVADKLYNDFKKNKDLAEVYFKSLENYDWLFDKYIEYMNAFKLIKDKKGVLVFM